MHNHNELTRSSLPNWSQRQDFPVSSDKIVEWLLGTRAATWCNISLGHVRFIHSCFLSRYNLDTNVWSLFLLGRRWRYRGSLRMNPGSHLSFFFFAMHCQIPIQSYRNTYPGSYWNAATAPADPLGFQGDRTPAKKQWSLLLKSHITTETVRMHRSTLYYKIGERYMNMLSFSTPKIVSVSQLIVQKRQSF